MRLSTVFLRLAVMFALVGVALGVGMGMTKSFLLSPVHAHMNLLGWVSMFLYGLFYRVAPVAAVMKLSRYHFALSVAGVVVFLPSLALELVGGPAMAGAAAAGLGLGSMLILVGMLMFAIIVFHATRPDAS